MKSFQQVLFALFCAIVLSLVHQTYSQQVYFCEGVDDDGYPINESDTFTIPEDGGYLYVLVRLDDRVNCTSVNLMIYNGDEELQTTLTVDTKKNWTWFWKKIAFYEEGEFIVDVWDCDFNSLATGIVEIEVE